MGAPVDFAAVAAAVVVAFLVVAVAWYSLRRPRYYRNASLTRIEYRPGDPQAPLLRFGFRVPLDAVQVGGSSAFVAGFTPDGANADPAAAAALVAVVTGARAGGTRAPATFAPVFDPASPNAVSTNTAPAGVSALPGALTVTGSGEVWFLATPRA